MSDAFRQAKNFNGRDEPGHDDEEVCGLIEAQLTPSFFCKLDDDVVY